MYFVCVCPPIAILAAIFQGHFYVRAVKSISVILIFAVCIFLYYWCQVFTISLLADKKYHHFRPVLDAYIEDLFGATKADQ